MPSKINIIVISIGIFLNYICPISVLSEADQRERSLTLKYRNNNYLRKKKYKI